jgi:hypothetical protein
MTDTTNPVTQALEPGVFDVLSFIEKTAYPTERIVVFQNAKAADDYVKAVADRDARDNSDDARTGGVPDPETDPLTIRINELADQIRESSIVFDLRGMPPGFVGNILNKEDLNEIEKDDELIALSIVKVSNSRGEVDPRTWSREMVSKLRTYLKESEFAKLIRGVANVNLNSAIFDQAVDAGFLSGSSDVAV